MGLLAYQSGNSTVRTNSKVRQVEQFANLSHRDVLQLRVLSTRCAYLNC